jgi:hypothetical protein
VIEVGRDLLHGDFPFIPGAPAAARPSQITKEYTLLFSCGCPPGSNLGSPYSVATCRQFSCVLLYRSRRGRFQAQKRHPDAITSRSLYGCRCGQFCLSTGPLFSSVCWSSCWVFPLLNGIEDQVVVQPTAGCRWSIAVSLIGIIIEDESTVEATGWVGKGGCLIVREHGPLIARSN